jgi:hypothetical protein
MMADLALLAAHPYSVKSKNYQFFSVKQVSGLERVLLG